MNQEKLNNEIIQTARLFNVTGLSIDTSGNLSAMTGKGFLITPTKD